MTHRIAGRASMFVTLSFLALPGPATGQATPAASAARLRLPEDGAEIPMPRRGDRWLVSVNIGSAGPYQFLIDTGSAVSIVDRAIADDLGLKVVGQMGVGSPGGEPVDANLVRLPDLTAGDLGVEGATPVVLALREMTGGLLDGVLGLDVFREVLLTLDFPGQRARVTRGRLEAGAPGVIPVDLSGGRPAVQIDVAGHTVRADIDSGSPGQFTLPGGLIDTVPTVPGSEGRGQAGLVGGSRALRTRELDGIVRVAGLEYNHPRIDFMDPSPGVANLGVRFLADMVLTLDSRDGLVALQRGGMASQAPPERRAAASGPRRLGVRFGGPGGLADIVGVDPGSLGEKAGFKAGDRVVSLNGRPMSDYDAAALGTLIRGTEPLRWEVERDGVVRVIVIPGGQ